MFTKRSAVRFVTWLQSLAIWRIIQVLVEFTLRFWFDVLRKICPRFLSFVWECIICAFITFVNTVAAIYDYWHELPASKRALHVYDQTISTSDYASTKEHIIAKLHEFASRSPVIFHHRKVNLCVAGAAGNNVYSWGATLVLHMSGIRIDKAAGCSSGALVALLATCDKLDLKDTPLFEAITSTLPTILENFPYLCFGPVYKRALERVLEHIDLPEDDRLFISVTQVPRSQVVSRFRDKANLLDVMIKTALIPGITEIPKFTKKTVQNSRLVENRRNSNIYLDGGFSDNAPVSALADTGLPTIVINPLMSDLSLLQFLKRGLMPSTEEIVDSMLMGAKDMADFLQQQNVQTWKGIEFVPTGIQTVQRTRFLDIFLRPRK